MRIALLTFYSPDYQPLADVTVPNKDAYCRTAGYDHVVKVGPYGDPKHYYAIDRLVYLQDLLFKEDRPFEFVWVLNVHTYIMNFTRRLEEFLTEQHDFFITADCHGLNAGSFVVRKSEWSRRWLAFLIEKAIVIDHGWYEQKVMQDYAGTPEWSEKIKILPQNSINSYDYRLYNMSEGTEGHFKSGDFVFHAPGIAASESCSLLEARVKLFSGDWVKQNVVGAAGGPEVVATDAAGPTHTQGMSGADPGADGDTSAA